MSPREAWRKWLADLSSTRTQVVLLVFGLWAWAWVDLLIKPHTPQHVLDLLKSSTPAVLGGLFAWIAGKVVSGGFHVSRRDTTIHREDDQGD